MQRIELDQQSPWYKLFFLHEYGLEGNPIPIYDIKDIELAKKNLDWAREFCGEYLGLIGNTFSEYSLQKCKELAKELEDVPVSKETQKVIACDPAWGTGSRFGIVGLEYLKDLGKFRVILAEEYSRPHMNDILDFIWNTKKELGNVSNIYVDAASAVMVQSLKRMFNENSSESYMKTTIDNCKKFNIPIESRMLVVPLSFSTMHKLLLQNCKWITELTDDQNKAVVAIPQKFDKLLTGLRTSISAEYSLDKSATSFNDIVDAYRMCCYFCKRRR
jgi:hypothetical protein